MSKKKILGIDPSLTATGYSVVIYDEDRLEEITPFSNSKNLLNLENKYKPKLLRYGVIRTNSKNSLGQRVYKQRIEMEKLIKEIEPDLIVCEDQYGHLNISTLKKLSHVRGNFMTLAEEYEKPFYIYSPGTLKKIVTGKGNSSKKKVMERISSYYDKEIKDDNEADAIGLAVSFTIDRSKIKKI